jgi:hypothetical protein
MIRHAHDELERPTPVRLHPVVSLPTLERRGYTIEVENSAGRCVWATAIAPTKRMKAPEIIQGKIPARFKRMSGTCLIYRQANND